MAETAIEWTHRVHPKTKEKFQGYTFNPWIGCQRVSPACRLCYAITLDTKRFSKIPAMGGSPENPVPHFGPEAPRYRTAPDNWKKPLKWNREAEKAGIALAVFCASLADVFDDKVKDAWRDDLFALVEKCPNLDWLILTKRPENARKYFSRHTMPAHIWLGATMENQACFDARYKELLMTPGAERYFASMEPLLGPVDISAGLPMVSVDGMPGLYDIPTGTGCACDRHVTERRLDWVIVGGESHDPDKSKSAQMHPDHVLGVRGQAWAACVPFFFKQWGDWAPAYELTENPQAQAMCVSGMVRSHEFPTGEGGRRLSFNVGKSAAGSLFEGHKHRAMPPFRLLG